MNSPVNKDLSQMQIALPLPCIFCSYDLKGLHANHECPECSEPVRLTVFAVVDPVSKRMDPLPNSKYVGNLLALITILCSLAGILMIIPSCILRIFESDYSQISPTLIQRLPMGGYMRQFLDLCFASGVCAFCAFVSTMFLLKHLSKNKFLKSCRNATLLMSAGLLGWSLCMWSFSYTIPLTLNPAPNSSLHLLLYTTLLPGLAAACVFFGFRLIIPPIGKHSRKFRQANMSRQRMNDMLCGVLAVFIGRCFVELSTPETTLYAFGVIIEVMSLALVGVGLGYLVWNSFWIRHALIKPPPSIKELLRET